MKLRNFLYALALYYAHAEETTKEEAKLIRRQNRKQLKAQFQRRNSQGENVLQPRTERIGVSLCKLRTEDMGPGQCCPGVDLKCYGCNPNLLALGIPCEDQALSKVGTEIVGRDCFCDASCQDFRDCCSDHRETCPELTTESTTTTKMTTTTAITTKFTTLKTKKTRPPSVEDESWIFDRLFQELKKVIDQKFQFSIKYQNFLDRFENARYFFLNAEHNCRYNKRPYVGDQNDGTVKNFDGIFGKIEDPDAEFNHRANAIQQGFNKYVKAYYYSAQTTIQRQGCDGDSITPNKRGIHFKTKRVGRKVSKLIKKIIRRKAF